MLRAVSALVIGAILGVTLWLLPYWATAVLGIIAAILAAIELAGLSARVNAPIPAGFVGSGAAAVLLAFVLADLPSHRFESALGVVVMALVVSGGMIALSLGPPSPSTLTRAALLIMGPVYIGVPLGALVSIQWTNGPAATTWLVATLAASDITQYYTGRRFGRTKLAPTLSPGKTNEGAVGGIVAALVTGALLGPVCVAGLPAALGALIALFVATFGIAGDLFESLLKRSAGAKDASALIPGHGGVLDRLDSYLFAAPIFYICLRYVA